MAREQTWTEQRDASVQIDIRPVPEGRRSKTPGKRMLYPSARMVADAIGPYARAKRFRHASYGSSWRTSMTPTIPVQ